MSPYTGVSGAIGWLESRDDATRWMPQNNFNRSRNGFFQAATNRTGPGFNNSMFFNDLKFSAAKSIRTSAIILASFNIIAAFATALGILCDSYFRKRRNDRNFRFWRNGFTFVPEAESYPLVLAVGIFIQGFIFAGAQSTGLDSLFGFGCTWLAQLMLPAVFIAPYTQLVFGVEIAMRALRKKPFAPRGKYNVPICLSIIGALLLANFLIADFDQAPNICISSLFWFVAHYSIICFGLLVAIAVIVLMSAVTVFVRLHRSIKVEVTARVAASRMVYYLALSVISIGFMVPFFFVNGFKLSRGPNNSTALTLAMVASVVSNVSGLMTGGLYLFLKSSTLSTIGPRDKVGEYENRRGRYKVRHESNDPDDDDDDAGFGSHMTNPVTNPRGLRRVDSEASLIMDEKEEEAMDGRSIRSIFTKNGRRTDSIRSNKLVSAVASVLLPRAPEPARVPSSLAGSHMRKRSYSLFPRNTVASKSSMLLLPATTYAPVSALKPPPSMANLANMRHRRDSSLVSSATVQIGIRLSSVDDIPQNKATTSDSVIHTLGCPYVLNELEMQSPKRAGAVGGSDTPTTLPFEATDESPARDPVKDAKMKTLPAVPRIDSQVPRVEPAPEEVTLSPTVYSPKSPTKAKLPSPRGVGFTIPPSKSANASSPPRSPPRRRGTGETTPVPTDAKGDWI
ncbi:hypothetical protein C8A00DRAFT_38800 [Chaetomidium leptoderma]|uniref:Uncharacterized protein n=1 Tax=Chaetomidium leptoderma TaxID=669021 RepID=A0AAN6ZR21_9PEZI|nr:hypothetical protein C8A00DRAFT_38800 [Chaetomidium leptoderma]